jgi:hypothetical protein
MPMPFRPAAVLACVLAALAVAPAASAGPGMFFGAAEDAAKSADPMTSKAKMDLAVLAGFDAIRLTAIWTPGETELHGYERLAMRNAVVAADLTGVRIVLSVYHYGSSTTPLNGKNREEFATFAAWLAEEFPTVNDVIVGNEPNLNRFWMPQFNKNGTSASPGGYLSLLGLTYDHLKAVRPEIRVIGGSVSPRGADKPKAKRQTHSPYRFISELGKAYRRSGRQRPVMDAFAFHPYGDSSTQPPSFRHTAESKRIGMSDYDRLVELLGEAFDGTQQEGSQLPIVYDEYGVEATIPVAKRGVYKGREPKSIRPVDEQTQARYYRDALLMAACQPTVEGMLLFHVSDEPDLDRWQSGIFYADDTPKASFTAVRDAVHVLRGETALDTAGAGPTCPAAAGATRVGAARSGR